MKIEKTSEAQLIERIHRILGPAAEPGLRIGMGDDAAVIRARPGSDWVVSTDAFLEDIHFLLRLHPPAMVGYKALARATSDLAAMGARPRYFLMNLALPRACPAKWFDSFLRGMAQAARNFGMVLAGGDTTYSKRLAINLTVIGEVSPNRALLRSGARPGNLIYVSGVLGQAAAGLTLLRRGGQQPPQARSFLRRHLRPEPRLALGAWLAQHGRATAAIDISDGLSTDLTHLCVASKVGARIWSDKIPVPKLPPGLKLRQNPLELALNGGDDYELLFTVSRDSARRLPRTLGGLRVSVIGEVTREKQILLMDPAGTTRQVQPGGWDPFRTREARGKT